MEEISEKNKKSEILEAYHAALRQLKERERVRPPVEQKQKREQQELVKETKGISSEAVVKGISALKYEIAQSLDGVESAFSQKFKEFKRLISAIEVAQANLEELYSISSEAETLEALIESQKSTKARYEGEMRAIKADWDQQKAQFERGFSEEQKAKELEQKRAEEAYTYGLKLARQKEQDAYEQRKHQQEQELIQRRAEVEKELGEREERISQHEAELESLRQQVENFPQQLDERVASTRLEAEERIRAELQFEMRLASKEMEGERRLFQQEIEALKAKIVEQEQRIAQLSEKSHEAHLQVKEIAVKAVEGAAFRQLKTVMAEE